MIPQLYWRIIVPKKQFEAKEAPKVATDKIAPTGLSIVSVDPSDDEETDTKLIRISTSTHQAGGTAHENNVKQHFSPFSQKEPDKRMRTKIYMERK